MRQIKFRAWDLDNNWMDDNFFIQSNGVVYDFPSRVYDTPNIEIEENPNLIIMQYTGLTDKNGKEIYEGDVVQYGGLIWCADYHKENNPSQAYQEIKTAEVCYRGTSFIARLFEFEDGYPLSTLEIHKDFSGFNVIGNIYENPELLNG